MPFREKMKRALGRNDSTTSLSKKSTAQSTKSKKSKKEKAPDNIYKPGEKMPQLKYRGPWNQAHQDLLSSFSFGDSIKRRKSSANDEYSPMGSRIFSRRPSIWSRRSKMGSRQSSYRKDVIEEKDKTMSRRASMAGVGEAAGDGDVRNVGLSRQNTAENVRPRTSERAQATKIKMEGLDKQKTITNGDVHKPLLTNGRLFTDDELAKAFSNTTIKAS